VQKVFGDKRKVANLDYNEAVEALAAKGDATAKLAKAAAFAGATPAIVRATEMPVVPYLKGE
jgi:hypothetical protein